MHRNRFTPMNHNEDIEHTTAVENGSNEVELTGKASSGDKGKPASNPASKTNGIPATLAVEESDFAFADDDEEDDTPTVQVKSVKAAKERTPASSSIQSQKPSSEARKAEDDKTLAVTPEQLQEIKAVIATAKQPDRDNVSNQKASKLEDDKTVAVAPEKLEQIRAAVKSQAQSAPASEKAPGSGSDKTVAMPPEERTPQVKKSGEVVKPIQHAADAQVAKAEKDQPSQTPPARSLPQEKAGEASGKKPESPEKQSLPSEKAGGESPKQPAKQAASAPDIAQVEKTSEEDHALAIHPDRLAKIRAAVEAEKKTREARAISEKPQAKVESQKPEGQEGTRAGGELAETKKPETPAEKPGLSARDEKASAKNPDIVEISPQRLEQVRAAIEALGDREEDLKTVRAIPQRPKRGKVPGPKAHEIDAAATVEMQPEDLKPSPVQGERIEDLKTVQFPAASVESAAKPVLPQTGIEALNTVNIPTLDVAQQQTVHIPAPPITEAPTMALPPPQVQVRPVRGNSGKRPATPITEAKTTSLDTLSREPAGAEIINQPTMALPVPLRRPDLKDIITVIVTLAALVLWWATLSPVTLEEMNDLGLISVLSPGFIVALAIIVVTFAITLQRRELRRWLLALQLIGVIVILFGTPNLIEQMLRFTVVYKHAGYTDYIMTTGSVDPGLDIYFNWPGFFILAAFFTKVFGYSTILSFAGWAPIFYNVIYFFPMYMIFSTITKNQRHIWLALLFFYLTNWVGQDYFSPQGLNFFLYMVIAAILVKWFRTGVSKRKRKEPKTWLMRTVMGWLRAPDPAMEKLPQGTRVGLLLCLLAVYGLVIFSHPLTPFFVLLCVFLLMFFRRSGNLWLFLLLLGINVLWLFTMARPYLLQHVSEVIGTLGDLTGNVPKSITSGKSQGSILYQYIGKIRLYMTLFLWGTGFLGILYRMRKGYKDVTYILLAIAGFPLIAAQSYGGEMLMRIYLFTEPFMCFFAAALFCERPGLRAYSQKLSARFSRSQVQPALAAPVALKARKRTIPWRTIAIAAINLFLVGTFLFTRYGDERVDFVSFAEWDVTQHLYQIAPSHSFIMEGWDDAPLYYKDYAKYSIHSLTVYYPDGVIKDDASGILNIFINQKNPHAYLIFSKEQQVHASAWNGVPAGALQKLEKSLLATKEFKMVYGNEDAQILQFIGMGGGS